MGWCSRGALMVVVTCVSGCPDDPVSSPDADAAAVDTKVDVQVVEDLPATDTGPPPVHPPTSDFILGAYYMPKPHAKTHQWYGVEKWNGDPKTAPDDLRTPLMGLYSGRSVAAFDWHTRWALEHGISFFIFDEFWTVSPEKDPRPDYTNLDTFLAASSSESMRFAVMLTGAATPQTSKAALEAFLLTHVVPHWVKHYFARQSYMTIDDKWVVVIYSPAVLLPGADYGQIQPDVTKLLAKMSDKAKQLSGREVYWISQQEWIGPKRTVSFSWYRQAGFAAVAPYKLGLWKACKEGENQAPRTKFKIPYKTFTDRVVTTNKLYQQSVASVATAGELLFVPNIPTNYDGRLASPKVIGEHLHTTGHSLAVYDNALQEVRKLAAGEATLKLDTSWRVAKQGRPVIILSTWNEWYEDTALEPGRPPLVRSPDNPANDRGDAFAVLKLVRRVFTHEDNSPTYGLPPDLGLDVGPRTKWSFKPSSALELWYTAPGATAPRAIPQSNHSRSWISDKLYLWTRTTLPAQSSHTVSVEMNIGCPASQPSCIKAAAIHWGRSELPGYSILQGKIKMSFAVQADGQWHTYKVPVGSSAEWISTIDVIGLFIRPDLTTYPDLAASSVALRSVSIDSTP